MDQRRRGGLIAMGAGLVAALLGELSSHYALLAGTFAVLATAGLIGGGVVVALTYREEASGQPSTSRLSMLASSASVKASRRVHTGADTGDMAALTIYATQFNDELSSCEHLLAGREVGGDAVGPAALEAARERIVTFVASPSFGEATRRGLVDEARVRDLSVRLAAAI